MFRPMAARQALRNMCAVMAVSSLLAACDSRHIQAHELASGINRGVVVPPIVYGRTAQGVQLSEFDDSCDVPGPLRQAVQDQLIASYGPVFHAQDASTTALPLLKIEIVDIVTVSAGGPMIVVIHGVLERPTLLAAQFTSQRQMHMPYSDITAETTECSMRDQVIHELGKDVAKWMLNPVDGAFLVSP